MTHPLQADIDQIHREAKRLGVRADLHYYPTHVGGGYHFLIGPVADTEEGAQFLYRMFDILTAGRETYVRLAPTIEKWVNFDTKTTHWGGAARFTVFDRKGKHHPMPTPEEIGFGKPG